MEKETLKEIERMAKWLHDNYEEIAKETEWQTQESCKVEFKDLPEKNKQTMLKLAEKLHTLFQDQLPKWISVEERLPICENDESRMETVLVFNGTAPEYNQNVFKAMFFKQTMDFSSRKDYLGKITHWQPLPNPPHSDNSSHEHIWHLANDALNGIKLQPLKAIPTDEEINDIVENLYFNTNPPKEMFGKRYLTDKFYMKAGFKKALSLNKKD